METPRLYRTAVHVDSIAGETAVCTPGGLDLPPGSVVLAVSALPPDPQPGKVFFARVNLAAEDAKDVVIEEIESEWGSSAVSLHFDESVRLPERN
jgi:hypothetical protein